MGSIVSRLWRAFTPPQVEKRSDAIRFGILGAAGIAPLALIIPAKSHPEVIVQAVAARNRERAEKFAKSHGIPDVRTSYEEIINDPNIDAVLVPLPNGLHFEWAVRALRAGKHVLLEKPSVSNSEEAEILFNLPELSQPGGPVLLEAAHNRFHPSWLLFRSLFDPADVTHVYADSMIPWWGTSKDDIHFNYGIAGGTMMAMGCYSFAIMREAFGAEPVECVECTTNHYTDGIHDKCDWDFRAKFSFPNGSVGEAKSTLRGPTVWKPSHVQVTTKQIPVVDETLPDSQEKLRIRKVTLHGFVQAFAWSRIDVVDSFEIRSRKDGRLIKKWREKKSHKAYSFKEAGGEFAGVPGENWWMSYRYQLEEFVNRVKGRKTQTWISQEDSINNMKMIDMAYVKSGLGPRPSSGFKAS
ncbi:putative oxidoreductase [Nemania abortiva]|nr:putative oxidoreductase [Nemania abortiva]